METDIDTEEEITQETYNNFKKISKVFKNLNLDSVLLHFPPKLNVVVRGYQLATGFELHFTLYEDNCYNIDDCGFGFYYNEFHWQYNSCAVDWLENRGHNFKLFSLQLLLELI